MSKVMEIKTKLEKHQAYYDKKIAEYRNTEVKSMHLLCRLMDLSNLITKLIIELNNEMAIAAFTVEQEIVEEQRNVHHGYECNACGSTNTEYEYYEHGGGKYSYDFEGKSCGKTDSGYEF